MPEERLKNYAYTDVIDFAAQRRYRSHRVFEARLTTNGSAVGVIPGRRSQLAVLNLPNTASSGEELDACPESDWPHFGRLRDSAFAE